MMRLTSSRVDLIKDISFILVVYVRDSKGTTTVNCTRNHLNRSIMKMFIFHVNELMFTNGVPKETGADAENHF